VTELEKLVWAASYAAEFSNERRFYSSTPGCKKTIDDISGFSCAEVADVAVAKLREAFTGEDREYLLPIREKDSDA